MKNEKFVFGAFLEACPDFADEPITEWDVIEEWYSNRKLSTPDKPFDKRPDVICITESGRKIGVELKSWLNEGQIAKARGQEKIEQTILKAIREQPPNETTHISHIWLYPKQVRFDRSDADDFRQQIFSLIENVDATWSNKPGWEQDHSDYINDFGDSPILEKYLYGIRVHPDRRGRFNIQWILFPTRGCAYSPDEMRETLTTSLLSHRSDKRYEDICAYVGLDEVYLLVHYDFNSFAYNTPYGAPGFGFRECAELASKLLEGDCGYFDKIFLFHYLIGEEDAVRIC